MTAATITPADAGADLLGELRQLLDRHDTASTLDEVREIADEVASVLRRTRGRIGRLARKVEPKPAPEPAAERPVPAAETTGPRPPAEPSTPPAAAEKAPAPVPAPSAPDTPAVRAPTPALATFQPRASRSRLVAALLAVTAAVAHVARAVASAVRRAALVGRRRHATTPAGPERSRAVDDQPMTAIPDLNAEQVAGLSCVECGTDFVTTGTLKVPAGIAESTGDAVFACVGECAARAGNAVPAGEQMELLS